MAPDADVDGVPREIGTAGKVEDKRHSDDGAHDREDADAEHTDDDDLVAAAHLQAEDEVDRGGEERNVGERVADRAGVVDREVVDALGFGVEAEGEVETRAYGLAGEDLEKEEDEVVDDYEAAVAVDEPVYGAGGGCAGETFDEEDDGEFGEGAAGYV